MAAVWPTASHDLFSSFFTVTAGSGKASLTTHSDPARLRFIVSDRMSGLSMLTAYFAAWLALSASASAASLFCRATNGKTKTGKPLLSKQGHCTMLLSKAKCSLTFAGVAPFNLLCAAAAAKARFRKRA